MAAEELSKVRAAFAERVTKEMIKELLDLLLTDQVLNTGEKDSILEENPTRADKARALADTVIRKGDKASTKMLDYLRKKDPTLCTELGLSEKKLPQRPQSRQPAGRSVADSK